MGSPFRKKKIVVPVGLAAIIFLVALVPFVLSSSVVLQMVQSFINSRVPGEFAVGSWLVGWRQGIFCQDVVYQDPARGIRIRVPRVTSTQGVLELAFSPADLGTLIIDSPVMEMIGLPPKSPAVPVAQSELPGFAVGKDRPFWDSIRADLHLRDGRLTMQPGGKAPVTGLRDCSIDASLEGGMATFELDVRAVHGQGIVKVRGSLNLPARRHGWVETMIADMELVVMDLQMRDLLLLAAGRWNVPVGEGVLDAELQLQAVGFEGIRLSGFAGVRDLKLEGGFLGRDAPSFQSIRLKVDDGKWSGKSWSVNQFDLVSDTLEAHGSGRSVAGEVELAGRGSIHLPVLFDQFPHRLRLHEAAFIEKGEMEFDLDLLRSKERANIAIRAGADDLGGLYGGSPFSWTSPVSIRLNGERTDREVRIDALRIDAPFLQVEGRGGIDDFSLDASADLDRAFFEIGRLFQLEWSGSGRAEVAMRARTAGMEEERAGLEADVLIDDFALSRSGDVVIPVHDLSLAAGVQAPRAWGREKQGPVNLQLALSTWLGEIFVAVSGEKGAAGSFRGRYSTDASLDLQPVSELLRMASVMDGGDALAGDLEIQAMGYLDGEKVEVRELQGEAVGFVFRRQGDVFADRRMQLEIRQSVNDDMPSFAIRDLVVAANRKDFFQTGAGFNVINPAGRSLFLRSLSLTSTSGTITVEELLVPDWRKPLDNVRINLDGALELDRLASLLRTTGLLSAGYDMGGMAKVAVRTGEADGGGRKVDAGIRFDDFTFSRENREIFKREEMNLKAELHALPDGRADIRSLRFRSRPLTVSATGTLKSEGDRYDIECRGEMTPNLEQCAAVLRSAFDVEMTMTGGGSAPFYLRFPVGGGPGLPPPAFRGGLDAVGLRYRGLDIREMSLAAILAERKLRLETNGSLNGGRMAVTWEGDFTAEPPVFRVSENSRIMTGIELRKGLIDGVLARIHPLFGVLAVPSGLLDVRLDSFSWPLRADGGKDAVFIVVFDMRNVSLAGSAVLQDILTGSGLEKERLRLRDSEIYCSGQAGRIICSPLHIFVADVEMALGGSTGMDGSLDYQLQVPAVRKPVSEGMPQTLEQTSVSVPVRGTVSKPVVDRAMIPGAIGGQRKKAEVGVMEGQGGSMPPVLSPSDSGGQEIR